jgi:hypothetical protein
VYFWREAFLGWFMPLPLQSCFLEKISGLVGCFTDGQWWIPSQSLSFISIVSQPCYGKEKIMPNQTGGDCRERQHP